MSTIVTRAGKGSALTWAEADANFTNLNNDKAELASPTFTGVPSADTAVSGTNTTQLATTAFVQGKTAAQTPFTATGNIVATNVQSAIAEVDTEKVAKAGDTMTGQLKGITPVSADDLTRKDYVDRLLVFAQIEGHYYTSTLVSVNTRAVVPLANITEIDPFNIVDTANGRITPTLPGYYMVTMSANVGVSGATFLEICPFRNASYITCGLRSYPTNISYLDENGSRIMQFNGTTDYVIPGWKLNNAAGSGSIDVNDGGFYLIVQYLGPLP